MNTRTEVETNQTVPTHKDFEAYVYTLASTYTDIPRYMEFQDLVQEGHIALIETLQSEIKTHASVSTTAYYSIKKRLRNKALENSYMFTVGSYLPELLYSYNRAQKLYPNSTDGNYMKLLGISETQFKNIKEFLNMQSISGDKLVDREDETSTTLLDKVPCTLELLETQLLTSEETSISDYIINDTKKILTDKQTYVLEQVLAKRKYREIGEDLGCSRQAVGLLVNKIKDRIVAVVKQNKRYSEYFMT